MKTRADDLISRFMSVILETDNYEDDFQKLLDTIREIYDLDVVYVLDKADCSNIYCYKYSSVSRPEYDKKGVHMVLTEDECVEVLHMYDDSPICNYNVKSASDFGASDCIIHFGFVRKSSNSYDGSIGFQCFKPHIWSEEEKNALIKLGRLYRMMLSVPLANGIYEHFYNQLNLERNRYRDVITEGALFSFSMDITDGFIREKVFTSRGDDLLNVLGSAFPASYDELCRRFLEASPIGITDPDEMKMFNCQGLTELFISGNTHPEVEYFHPNLNTFIRVTVFMYRNSTDNHIHGLFVSVDVTEVRQKQEIQRQALQNAYDAANHANEAKSKFLSNMSHDIRTPMNGIIGMTAIAGAHLDDKERVADCLSKIMTASKHLLGLLNKVLDMSKIESGKIELHDEEFSLPDLLNELVTITKPQIEAKHHEFFISAKDIVHENVIGDKQRLQQVFLNLLSNAIKYTPENGTIRLTISEKPYHRKDVGCYVITFEDNGIGMSREFLEHLYDPFTRAEDSRMTKVQGTGLGMAITNNIVRLMDGRIDVESEPDKGTKFTVTVFLKLMDGDEPSSYEMLTDLSVLVVDDDKTSGEYACTMLGELGMISEYAPCGEDAVKRVLERHNEDDDFAVVILDWKMPGMDGMQVTREIRRQVGDNMPIIIISAYDWSEIEVSARAAGANAFLNKPLFKSKMICLFKELIGHEKQPQGLSELNTISKDSFSGKRVLLVEDNELNAEIAGEILGMTGLEVAYARDGKEALDLMTSAESGYYDIVFMDIQMPIMNGYEATKAIRSLPGEYPENVPIIAMTANAFMGDVLACKAAGMDEHIAKPLELDRLFKILSRWLGNK